MLTSTNTTAIVNGRKKDLEHDVSQLAIEKSVLSIENNTFRL